MTLDEVVVPVCPFASTALDYLEAGWSPLPMLDTDKKNPPPGFTGWGGRDPSRDEVERWIIRNGDRNIALRLPSDVVAIDVDDYDGKGGGETIAKFCAEHGDPLPTICSTARALPSGKYLYRVPVGTVLRSALGPGVEILQRHHRYCVAWPSVHATAGPVRWVDVASGEVLDRVPEVDDLADLPYPWLEELSVTKAPGLPVADTAALTAWRALDGGTRPHRLDGIVDRLRHSERGGRHDAALWAVCRAAEGAAEGHFAAGDAEQRIREVWTQLTAGENRDHELESMLAWAVGQVRTDIDRVSSNSDVSTDAPESVNGTDGKSPAALPPEFWQQRPWLAHVEQAARSRIVGPHALLVDVLARVAAITPHSVVLPPLRGGVVGLTLLAIPVGPPGTSKSASANVAGELVPAPDYVLDRLPVGTGEGLIEALFEKVTEDDDDGNRHSVRRQTRHSAIVTVDEGTALVELAGRNGATIMPTLRTAFTHGTLGNTNADPDRRRLVRGDAYVFGVVIGIQPEAAAALLDETAIRLGTPQRLLWATSLDPDAPDELPDWPGVLRWKPPAHIIGPTRRPLVVAPEVADEVRNRHRAVQRGDVILDALDGHRDLLRLKVAALTAILDGRLEVAVDDWRIAGQIIAASDAVRDATRATIRQVAAQDEEARTERRIHTEERLEASAETRALAGMARSGSRKVHDHAPTHPEGTCPLRCFTQATASKHRALVSVDEAIDRAVADGLVDRDGDRLRPRGAKP